MGRELERKRREFDKAVEAEERISREVESLDRDLRVAKAENNRDRTDVLEQDLSYALERSVNARDDVETFRRVMQNDRGR
jgi:hypothetical protein